MVVAIYPTNLKKAGSGHQNSKKKKTPWGQKPWTESIKTDKRFCGQEGNNFGLWA